MAHTVTITHLPTGEAFEVASVKDPNASRKRDAVNGRVMANEGWADCGHFASVEVVGDDDTNNYRLDIADCDRHYRDGDNWQVEGERGRKDYAINACLAVCTRCNQHGVKSAALQARLDKRLLATLRAGARQTATV